MSTMRTRRKDILKIAQKVLAGEILLYKIAEEKEKSFEEAIKDMKFKHPETKNDVGFGSLPAEEQKKIREEFNKSNQSEKEELSKEDKKVLDELSDLNLDTDEFMELFEKAVAEMNVKEPPDLSELKGMNTDELEGQAESLLMNFDDGFDALKKSLEDLSDEAGGKKKEEKKEKKKEKKKDKPKPSAEEIAEAKSSIEAKMEEIDDDFNDAVDGLFDELEELEQDLSSKNKSEIASLVERIERITAEKMQAYEDQYAEDVEKYGEEAAKDIWSASGSPDSWDDQTKLDMLETPDPDDLKDALKKIEKKEKQEAEDKKREEESQARLKKQKEEREKEDAKKKNTKKDNAEKRKDKSYRDEAKKKALEGASEITKEFSGDDYYEDSAVVEKAFEGLREAYGFGVEGDTDFDMSELSDEELDDFINAMDELDAELTKQFNEKNKVSNKEVADAKKRLKTNTAKLDKLEDELDKLEEMTEEEFEAEDANHYQRYKELTKEIKELQKKVGDDEYLTEDYKRKNDGMETVLDYTGENLRGYSNPNSLYGKALDARDDKAKKKKREEEQKKKEEEHKQKVKDYTKKINDLISSASSAKKSDEVTELFAEFGRIKGQLSGGEVFEEVKGDLDKAEKALNDAQESTSLGGKLKSFFGLGKGKKKASKAQRDKVAKMALELLKEEIALYKEEMKKKP